MRSPHLLSPTKTAGFGLLAIMVLLASCATKHYTEPLSPEQALKSFQLNDDFTIEIFAAEPFVKDPVDMIFDEEGKVYVVEMPDYPYQPKPGKAAGRILLLSDTNNDGRVDKSTIFADSLSEATSIMPWKGGLLVTAAPEIFYLKDTDGDSKADKKEVLFSGFFKNNSEAQITFLRFGIDNWIYANNRGQDGLIHFDRDKNALPLSVRGADFRFRLDENKFEPETGPGQFGQTIDQWGHRFFTENTIHLQNAVIPWRYLHRHAFLPSTTAVLNISDHDPIMFQETPPPYWRAERTDRRNKLYKEQKLTRVEYAEDHFTGGSGGTIYMGDAFPEKYYGNVFTGDVAGNLIHRDVLSLSRDSTRFVAHRDETEKDKEFLSSTDPWFRPVNFSVGPDGCLYVIDMYRQHIETPVSIPEDLTADMDFNRGMDQGRIYKIVPKKSRAEKHGTANLRAMKSADLVAELATTNQWFAIQAQRLLLERHDSSVISLAKQAYDTRKNTSAALRILYVLEGLNALDATLVKTALLADDANLRENALILAERYPELLPDILKATSDSVARVALQATLSLGNFKAAEVTPALAAVVTKHVGDPYFRMAVLSAEKGSSLEMLSTLANKNGLLTSFDSTKAFFVSDLAYIIGARNNAAEIPGLLKLVAGPAFKTSGGFQTAAITGLAKGLKKAAVNPVGNPAILAALNNLSAGAPKDLTPAIAEVKKLMVKTE